MHRHSWFVRIVAGVLGLALVATAVLVVIIGIVMRSWTTAIIAPGALAIAIYFLYTSISGFEPNPGEPASFLPAPPNEES